MSAAASKGRPISLELPTLQVSFAEALENARSSYLQEALRQVVLKLTAPMIDQELALYADTEALTALAARGIRGELVFPVPSILLACPQLIAYYRLLLGYSQKEFYGARSGLASFKSAESGGKFRALDVESLNQFCQSLCQSAAFLVNGIGTSKIHASLLDDLTLLTLGPQLRGGANVKRGAEAIIVVFSLIRSIVEEAITTETASQIVLKNASNRRVVIAFSSDPDIKIVEQLETGKPRNIIAIEIKGGTDYSNIHNRIGEAEKSHQNARRAKFVECWTIVNVTPFDEAKLAHESPSTNRFFNLGELRDSKSSKFVDFRAMIVALTGIKGTKKGKGKAKAEQQ